MQRRRLAQHESRRCPWTTTSSLPLLLFCLILLVTVSQREAFSPPQLLRRDWMKCRYKLATRFATKEDESKPDHHKLTHSESSSSSFYKNQKLNGKKKPPADRPRRKMELMWCGKDYCKDVIRERMVDEHVLLNGPATGQVAYYWHPTGDDPHSPKSITRYVLLLVRPGDEQLLQVAAKSIKAWTSLEEEQDCKEDKIHVMLDPTLAARLEHNYGVRSDCIHLFEPEPTPAFGSHLSKESRRNPGDPWDPDVQESIPSVFGEIVPDLIVTLGGDGLLMHASMLFQGPIPPILCVAGGSLGFLTPFKCDEMVDAVRIALGTLSASKNHALNGKNEPSSHSNNNAEMDFVFPPNMPSYPYDPLPKNSATFGIGGRICLSIRMRLCCQIMNRDGVTRARYNVLNEVVIDRGSSPYLAALECFCDDVHLTTVQADGIIFATPTGSTAYSMAAGGSVVHPAVPCILVTPICPHVLSFRSMIFPDHVILRCYVPDDARDCASVAFDGKHRQEVRRGESVQIRLSAFPVPTLNRYDHSSDWLGSLKQNFNFNTRPRQRPL